MTNGGFVAIRSNRSPATGSKKEPSRTSTGTGTSLRAALKRAIRSARLFTSVATTASLWVARWSAWTPTAGAEVEGPPHPLAQRELGQEVDAALMPRTWSGPAWRPPSSLG